MPEFSLQILLLVVEAALAALLVLFHSRPAVGFAPFCSAAGEPGWRSTA